MHRYIWGLTLHLGISAIVIIIIDITIIRVILLVTVNLSHLLLCFLATPLSNFSMFIFSSHFLPPCSFLALFWDQCLLQCVLNCFGPLGYLGPPASWRISGCHQRPSAVKVMAAAVEPMWPTKGPQELTQRKKRLMKSNCQKVRPRRK